MPSSCAAINASSIKSFGRYPLCDFVVEVPAEHREHFAKRQVRVADTRLCVAITYCDNQFLGALLRTVVDE